MAVKFYAREGTIFKGNSADAPVSGFDLERLLKFQLGVLNVPFNDDCCADQTILPVAMVDGVLSSYNPTTDSWDAVV